jgi:hypothetical protein
MLFCLAHHGSLTCLQVLQLLANYSIVSAPMFKGGTDTCVGFLDLNDVLAAILAWFIKHNVPAGDRLAKLQQAGVLDVHHAHARAHVLAPSLGLEQETCHTTFILISTVVIRLTPLNGCGVECLCGVSEG